MIVAKASVVVVNWHGWVGLVLLVVLVFIAGFALGRLTR